jgi:hypothetical protein
MSKAERGVNLDIKFINSWDSAVKATGNILSDFKDGKESPGDIARFLNKIWEYNSDEDGNFVFDGGKTPRLIKIVSDFFHTASLKDLGNSNESFNELANNFLKIKSGKLSIQLEDFLYGNKEKKEVPKLPKIDNEAKGMFSYLLTLDRQARLSSWLYEKKLDETEQRGQIIKNTKAIMSLFLSKDNISSSNSMKLGQQYACLVEMAKVYDMDGDTKEAFLKKFGDFVEEVNIKEINKVKGSEVLSEIMRFNINIRSCDNTRVFEKYGNIISNLDVNDSKYQEVSILFLNKCNEYYDACSYSSDDRDILRNHKTIIKDFLIQYYDKNKDNPENLSILFNRSNMFVLLSRAGLLDIFSKFDIEGNKQKEEWVDQLIRRKNFIMYLEPEYPDYDLEYKKLLMELDPFCHDLPSSDERMLTVGGILLELVEKYYEDNKGNDKKKEEIAKYLNFCKVLPNLKLIELIAKNIGDSKESFLSEVLKNWKWRNGNPTYAKLEESLMLKRSEWRD